ncbi:hypothetical protein KGF56_002201 [Candida oxycetoniae]|uniref:Glycosyl hydrolase family 92 domain-containing protein n=1 Tax=Candida oxycetoniae TaxID=497107 RepID=A0AAI9SYP3_9ASCO|nr:uncharacterized protein KGF56_002201 [Candida oxycetoniae]KAI3405036.1 hypothetical protein KGF56_002201 [Candida oxycetoniae]
MYDPFASDVSTKQGRGTLPDWLEYGYLTRNYTRSISRTVKYAYNDLPLSQVAQGLRLTNDYNKYLNRSANWQNIWNSKAKAKGYTYKNFIQPRNYDLKFNFTNYDFMSCGGCYWGSNVYKNKPVEYGFLPVFDIAKLIQLMGGETHIHSANNNLYAFYGKEIVNVGNEPSIIVPFLLNCINQQWRSVELVRYIMRNNFHSGVKGLPGNPYGGALQAWVIFNMIGISGSKWHHNIPHYIAVFSKFEAKIGKRCDFPNCDKELILWRIFMFSQ